MFEGFETNTPEKAWACAEKYGLSIPFGHSGGQGRRAPMMASYRLGGTPWTVIIDAKGVVRANDFHIEPEKAAALIETLRKEAKEGAPR